MLEKFGEDLVKMKNLWFMIPGTRMIRNWHLPSGARLEINKLAVEADLLIAEGFIEPHFCRLFGRKKKHLPGIASFNSILKPCAELIASSYSRTGILKTTRYTRHAGCCKKGEAFILNVVIDSNRKVINAFAGHREKAHIKGCSF